MNRQAGDTIVEVIVAIAVAALTLGFAYQLSDRSLRTSTQATQRSQALSEATAQIERLRDMYDANPKNLHLFRYPGSPDFCVDSNNGKILFSSGQCDSFESTIFTVDDSYDSTSDTFTFMITWPNINGHGQDQLSVYYKFP